MQDPTDTTPGVQRERPRRWRKVVGYPNAYELTGTHYAISMEGARDRQGRWASVWVVWRKRAVLAGRGRTHFGRKAQAVAYAEGLADNDLDRPE